MSPRVIKAKGLLLPDSDSSSGGVVWAPGSSLVLLFLLDFGLWSVVATNGWRAAPFLGLFANFLASARRSASKTRNLRQVMYAC